MKMLVMKCFRRYTTAIAVLLLLLPLALQSCDYVVSDSERYEVYAKSNLHTIQIAVERYKSKHGEYPPYLLGGDQEGWDKYNANRPEGAPYLSDPLIGEDFFSSYPQNPYANAISIADRKDRNAFKAFTKSIKGPSGDSFDPRFGLNGDKMGNALTEPYIFVKQTIRKLKGYPRMCPGQFYYKAFGEIESSDELESLGLNSPDDHEYESYTGYVLGVFGSVQVEGKDTIRWVDMSGNHPDEFPFVSKTDSYETSEGVDIDIHLRLPEVLGGGDADTLPFWPPYDYVTMIEDRYKNMRNLRDFRKMAHAAPDGFPDGVILTLFSAREVYLK